MPRLQTASAQRREVAAEVLFDLTSIRRQDRRIGWTTVVSCPKVPEIVEKWIAARYVHDTRADRFILVYYRYIQCAQAPDRMLPETKPALNVKRAREIKEEVSGSNHWVDTAYCNSPRHADDFEELDPGRHDVLEIVVQSGSGNIRLLQPRSKDTLKHCRSRLRPR